MLPSRLNNINFLGIIRCLRFVVITYIAFGISGCSKSDQLPTYPANGIVLFSDDRPLYGGTIIFESADHAVTARGTIGTDGRFELGTYKTGDGAVAGTHRVAISPPAQMDFDPDERTSPPVLHSRYTNPDTSNLEYSVWAKRTNNFEVRIHRP